MKVLITGVAGFVGSSLARVILNNTPDTEIIGIDNLSYGYRQRLEDIPSGLQFVQADIADIDSVLHGEKIDAIVHCAAIAPLPECQVDSHRAIVQNVANYGSITDFALNNNIRDIVFFSSGAIYEGTQEFPTPENTEIKPRLVYPVSKYMAEIYFQAMCRSHGLNVTAIRLFNLYGPQQDYFRKQPPLIGYLIRNLIEKTEAALFSTGQQRRDYVYIDDLLDLVQLSINKMRSFDAGGNFSAINAGSGQPVSVKELIAVIERLAGEKINISWHPSDQYWHKYQGLFDREIPLDIEIIRQEVEKHTQASTSKVANELGWSTKTPLDVGLKNCLSFAEQLLRGSR